MKLRQKAQTQNIPHIIETTQAKTACYFLLVGWNGRAQMEWAWKLQVRIREARAQAKSLFRVSGRHRYFTRKTRRKKKEKGLVNTDLNHRRTWINYSRHLDIATHLHLTGHNFTPLPPPSPPPLSWPLPYWLWKGKAAGWGIQPLWPLSSTGFLYLELVSVSEAKLLPFYYVRGLECRRVNQQRWFPGPNGSSLRQLQSVHHPS